VLWRLEKFFVNHFFPFKGVQGSASRGLACSLVCAQTEQRYKGKAEDILKDRIAGADGFAVNSELAVACNRKYELNVSGEMSSLADMMCDLQQGFFFFVKPASGS